MGLNIVYEEGQTPLDEEETEGLLIPTITTKQELNEFEQLNIEKAMEWSITRKFKPEKIFTATFIKQLHFKMFGDVWAWAGQFRKSNKNIGADHLKIAGALHNLLADALYWIQEKTYPENEIAIRFKHRLVAIHCFSNGNGRHSRLVADIINDHVFSAGVFSWGSDEPIGTDELRKKYMRALKEADNGNPAPLILFAKT